MPFCKECNVEHGPLYACESYSDEMLDHIIEGRERLRENLNDMPADVKMSYKLFLGIH